MSPSATPSRADQRIAVTLLAGDGIGPEITAATLRILDAAGAPLEFQPALAGQAAISAVEDPLPAATIDAIRATGLALKGPLETPFGGGFRSVNVALRTTFDLYANVRPALTILPGRYRDIDLVMIRENTEGLYSGIEHFIPIAGNPRAAAESTALVTAEGSRRIVQYAFEYARRNGRRKVTLVHKANILKCTSGLFLEVGREVAAQFPDIAFEEKVVDAMAMELVMRPERFDVIVTTNLFGDILSDQISGLVGGLGLAPGANLGSTQAIFEAVHGTAPDIAGQGVANPTAQLLAACLLLDHVGQQTIATTVRRAVSAAVNAGACTRDLGGSLGTSQYADAVIARLGAR